MTKPTAAQQIVAQDNVQVQVLLDQLDKAQAARDQAGAVWEADPTSEIAADALTEAAAVYHRATDDLAQLLCSLWKAGYRLTR